jgi:Domain of unknown function (DUF4153)
MIARLQRSFSQWIRALRIFPLPSLLLIAMSIIGIAMFYIDGGDTDSLMRLMAACALTLPLMMLAPLRAVIRNTRVGVKELALSACGIIIGALYYRYIPDFGGRVGEGMQVTIIGSLIVARSLLFVSIAWNTAKDEWQTRIWRKELITAVVLGGLAGLLIRWGVSASLASLEYLFGIDINGKAYGYTAIISLIFFAWSIALMHLAQERSEKDLPDYTRSLRIFGNYIFFPLTITYGCILISYGVKILITGIWPEGRVVYMVLGYIAFGLLTRLATYPALPHATIKKAHSALFLSFFLVSFLMIKAIWLRVAQYGFTIERYFVCALIAWIIIMSIGSLIRGKRRYLIIIGTLLCSALISLYAGPWNAAHSALRSQQHILRTVLSHNTLSLPLTSWSLASLGTGDWEHAYSSISYIAHLGDIDALHALIPQSQHAALDQQSPYMQWDYIMNYAGLNYANSGMYPENSDEYFNYIGEFPDNALPVVGASHVLILQSNSHITDNIIVFRYAEKTYTIDLTNQLADIYQQAQFAYNNAGQKTPPAQIQPVRVFTGDDMTLFITSLSWKKTSGSYSVDTYNGYALIR